MEYRIVELTYINKKGERDTPRYKIQTYKRFLYFWMRWRDITHLECGMGDCCQATTIWKDPKEAKKFAKEFLCEDKLYDGTETKVVESSSCDQ